MHRVSGANCWKQAVPAHDDSGSVCWSAWPVCRCQSVIWGSLNANPVYHTLFKLGLDSHRNVQVQFPASQALHCFLLVVRVSHGCMLMTSLNVHQSRDQDHALDLCNYSLAIHSADHSFLSFAPTSVCTHRLIHQFLQEHWHHLRCRLTCKVH